MTGNDDSFPMQCLPVSPRTESRVEGPRAKENGPGRNGACVSVCGLSGRPQVVLGGGRGADADIAAANS